MSDYHTLVTTIFRSTFIKLSPKIIRYRSYKTFNKQNFAHVLDQKLIEGDIYKASYSYSKLTEIFWEILKKHTPTKLKTTIGKQAPFMKKELSKIIMNKSRIKNKYFKGPSKKIIYLMKRLKINVTI